MGILTDFATSSLGDLTIGTFEGLNEAAERDVVVNATASSNSLNRENEAYDLTELAFKNRQEIANILAANPEAFGLSVQEGLDINQVADRFANFMFLQNRSIFENKDMGTVKLNVAKFMAQNPGEGFTIYDPYISGEDRFKQEQELHQARISEITKMPKADKLLMNIQKAEEGVATPESITNELTKVTALTAKGYGILNTFPTSQAGMKNMHFVMTNIITARAKEAFPDDAKARAEFINQRMYENNIDPTDGIMYSNNMNFQIMSDVISAQGGTIANQMLELTNRIAAAPAEEREALNDQLNQLVLEQHKTMDTYSKTAGTIMAGLDRSEVFPPEGQTITTPKVADGYVPTVNNKGEVIIDLANDTTQTFDLEMLVDFYTDSPEDFKKLPTQVQNYVSDIADKFFVDGQMVEPKREDFLPGRAGDKAFKDFTRIYNIFFPDLNDITSDTFIKGLEILEPTERTKLQKDDITKLKKDEKKGDEILIEELPPANTIIPKKKPDQPEEPKEKSLSDKIKEDFPNANVGTSGGNTKVEEGAKKKTDTQTQTENIFEGSGVDPIYQSASMKENLGEGAITFTRLINNDNMNNTYNYLRGKLNEKASAALLGNIYAENDTFRFDREEEGDINKLKDGERGYGIFQFTNYKNKKGEIVGHRKEYFNYLENTGKKDSIQSQIDYVLDNIYNGVGFNIGDKNRERLRESSKNDSIKEIANKFMLIFENPEVKNLDKRSNFALEAYEHYTTIQDKS